MSKKLLIPVPHFIRKQFINYLSDEEDIDTVFDQLDYCVNTEIEESIWSRRKVQSDISSKSVSLDVLFKRESGPEEMKSACSNSSCDISDTYNTKKCNYGKNDFVRTTKTVIKNKENTLTHHAAKKRTRKERNSNRIFHSTAIGSLENLSSNCYLSGSAETCSEFSLSEELFKDSPSNIKSNKPETKKVKTEVNYKKTKLKLNENISLKYNTRSKRTIADHKTPDCVEMNQEPLPKTDPLTEKSVKGNTNSSDIKAGLTPSKVGLEMVSEKNDGSTICSEKQGNSSGRFYSKPPRKSSWINQFELFLEAKQKSSGEFDSTLRYDSSSDDEQLVS